MVKLKYVKVPVKGTSLFTFIVFNDLIQHSQFKNHNPVSAGFVHFSQEKAECFGKSISLGIESSPLDSQEMTRQFFRKY